MLFNYFTCFLMIISGFGILVFQKNKLKNIVAISLIWFSIVIFVVSFNAGGSEEELFIFKIKNLSNPFIENALIIFDVVRIFTLSISLIIFSGINNKNALEKSDFKGEMK